MIGSATRITSSAPASPSSRIRAAIAAGEPSGAARRAAARRRVERDERARAALDVRGVAAGVARRGVMRAFSAAKPSAVLP